MPETFGFLGAAKNGPCLTKPAPQQGRRGVASMSMDQETNIALQAALEVVLTMPKRRVSSSHARSTTMRQNGQLAVGS